MYIFVILRDMKKIVKKATVLKNADDLLSQPTAIAFSPFRLSFALTPAHYPPDPFPSPLHPFENPRGLIAHTQCRSLYAIMLYPRLSLTDPVGFGRIKREYSEPFQPLPTNPPTPFALFAPHEPTFNFPILEPHLYLFSSTFIDVVRLKASRAVNILR